jgi:alkanesulfonate monooxygenase SsuD/methylene tetrahydromethanopterin reductase-like flavin-dependent oxidoreductase (luciferase family)
MTSGIPLAGPIVRFGARIIRDERIARGLLAGSPKQIAEKIQTYVDVGATHIIMNLQPEYGRSLLERFAARSFPAFARNVRPA